MPDVTCYLFEVPPAIAELVHLELDELGVQKLGDGATGVVTLGCPEAGLPLGLGAQVDAGSELVVDDTRDVSYGGSHRRKDHEHHQEAGSEADQQAGQADRARTSSEVSP
jgi:hypothetical protein